MFMYIAKHGLECHIVLHMKEHVFRDNACLVTACQPPEGDIARPEGIICCGELVLCLWHPNDKRLGRDAGGPVPAVPHVHCRIYLPAVGLAARHISHIIFTVKCKF